MDLTIFGARRVDEPAPPELAEGVIIEARDSPQNSPPQSDGENSDEGQEDAPSA